MINNLLTSPRPGGMPPGAAGGQVPGMVIGGLAGVASTYKGHSVKRYNEQDEYQKWEFYYEAGKEMTPQGAIPPTNANQNGFGNSSGTGGASGFGSATGGMGGTGSGSTSGFGQSGTGGSTFGGGNVGSGNLGSGTTNPNTPTR